MEPLVVVEQVTKHFMVRTPAGRNRVLMAVNGVDLSIPVGKTVGLVGESGCGKSTLGRCLVRLTPPSSGKILFRGRDIVSMSGGEFRPLRKKIQMVFQDPTDSLNPRHTVGQTLMEPLHLHTKLTAAGKSDRVRELMSIIGLKQEHLSRFPHQLSLGQQQRVGIARAIATSPDLVVLDEPTSALDVSVRGLIIELLMKLREEANLTYVFISHDLSVIKYMTHYVAVMYLGCIVEFGKMEDVFSSPLHPYTLALMAAIPIPDPHVSRKTILLSGDVPSPTNLPDHCLFYSRCFMRRPDCQGPRPSLFSVGTARQVACWLRRDEPRGLSSGGDPETNTGGDRP